jgi:hypothetical protein
MDRGGKFKLSRIRLRRLHLSLEAKLEAYISKFPVDSAKRQNRTWGCFAMFPADSFLGTMFPARRLTRDDNPVGISASLAVN